MYADCAVRKRYWREHFLVFNNLVGWNTEINIIFYYKKLPTFPHLIFKGLGLLEL